MEQTNKRKRQQQKRQQTEQQKETSSTHRLHWSVASEKYNEFARLCEKNKWHRRENLPRRGARDGKELEAFMEEGLGNGVPFNRPQVTRKFDLWKSSLQSTKSVRQLDESKIESAKDLFERVKSSTGFVVSMRAKLNFDDEESCLLGEVVGADSWLIRLLEKLRVDLIDATNHTARRSDLKDEKRLSAYTDRQAALKREFMASFLIEFMAEGKVSSLVLNHGADFEIRMESMAESFSQEIAEELISTIVMAIKRGGTGNETMKIMATNIISEFLTGDVNLSDDNLLTRSIFNIAGWLVSAVQNVILKRSDCNKLKAGLRKVLEASDATNNTDALKDLPTGKIDSIFTTKQGALHYPSAAFYKMARIVEKVCETVLVERNIRIFGSKIVDELAGVLAEIKEVKEAVQECASSPLDDTKPKHGMEAEESEQEKSTRSDLEEITFFLVSTYMNMRSSDFVRHVMSKGRRSLKQGTRPTMAVISAGGAIGRKSGQERKSNFVCFFCEKNGHTVTKCPDVTVRPKDGEATQKTIKHISSGKKKNESSYNWYFCDGCNRWNTHKSEDHAAWYVKEKQSMALGANEQDDDEAIVVEGDNNNNNILEDEEEDIEGAIQEECDEMNIVLDSL